MESKVRGGLRSPLANLYQEILLNHDLRYPPLVGVVLRNIMGAYIQCIQVLHRLGSYKTPVQEMIHKMPLNSPLRVDHNQV